MALSDVTEESVIARLKEYKADPDAYHERWGSSDKGVDYYIVWKGEFYPSKAIINAAHYVVMDDLKQKGRGYSGGLATMVPVLERLGFEYTAGKVNWDREEMILALDLYMRDPQPGKTSKEVAEVSSLLRKRAQQLGRTIHPKFRNSDGVYLKMMNFRRSDALQKAKGNKGMVRGAKLEEKIWSEWAGKEASLRDAAKAIRLSIETGIQTGEAFSDDADIDLAGEGGFSYQTHRKYERNPQNVRKKKAAVRKAGLPFACEACGFDFEKTYGKRGAEYIEIHHKQPIHTLKPGSVPKLSDLALLCSNCHRMAHRWGKLITVEEIASLIS